jgi:DNA-directed RNA polymerase subunit RPC12/RpoP
MRRFISTRPFLEPHKIEPDVILNGGQHLRDYAVRRPIYPVVSCPEPGCQQEIPKELLQAVGPVRCGECGTRFTLRPRVGVVRLADGFPKPEPEPEEVPLAPAEEPVPRLKRLLGRGGGGSLSKSIRTNAEEAAEWQARAEAQNETVNAWIRRSLAEAAELERAIALPDHDHPKQ